MKKVSSALLLTFLFINACYAQQYLNASCSDTICDGDTVYLTAASVDSIPLGTIISMVDDVFSSVVDIGFQFTFFGNNYSQCVISSNGYISFDLSQAGLFSPWMITEAFPSVNNPLNAICGPWHDTDPFVAPFGELRYATVGTAPHRKFVVNFCQVPLYTNFGGTCNDSLFTGQMILYESLRWIDVHLTLEQNCELWNSGSAIEGIQDSIGDVAVVVPGRNYGDLWTAKNDGYRFAPDDGGGYIVYPIPFNPIPISVDSIVWMDSSGTIIGSGSSVMVMPEETTNYIATGVSICGNFSDTVTITVEPCFGVGISSAQNANEIPADASVAMMNELGIEMQKGNYSQLNDLLKRSSNGFYILVISKNDQILERRKIYLIK